MKYKRYESLIRYRLWREWWISELESRENKLLDYKTGKPMAIEKRLLHERPKINDFAKFITIYCGAKLTIESKDNGYFTKILEDNTRIQKFAPTISVSLAIALLDFLKAVQTKTPPEVA